MKERPDGQSLMTTQMELKMKEICAGTKSRQDVVHESLQQYREVFVRTSQQMHILKDVSARLPPTLRAQTDPVIGSSGLSEIHLQRWSVVDAPSTWNDPHSSASTS